MGLKKSEVEKDVCREKPALYIEDLRDEFKNSLNI